jgi:glycosyltransferase involved in cell wall biosynthesis
LNIVLYVNNFLPNIGGKEIVVLNLAQQYRKMGHKVRVVGPGGVLSHRKTTYPFPVHRFPRPFRRFGDISDLLFLFIDLIVFGFDIVHAHTTNPNGYIAAMLKRSIRFPLIITPHGSDVHIIPGIQYGQLLDHKNRARIEFAIQHADALTAISDSIKTSLVTAGASESKIRMIPNGVDVDRFKTEATSSGTSVTLKLPDHGHVILSVGNYRECKGFENILRAMSEVIKKSPDTYCAFVGKGNDVLTPLVEELNLLDNIIIYGPVAYMPIHGNNRSGNDELTALFKRSTVYVSAGIDEKAEGMSLAVLEAIASGLPIVATDISGNRDVIENGQNGLLVEPNNPQQLASAVLDLIYNEDKRNAISEHQRSSIQKYSWHSIAMKYIEVYTDTIGNRN